MKSWSPWMVGIGIGVLSWFSFASVDKALGITTAFEHTAAIAGRAVSPPSTASYYREPDKSPKIGWEWMLVAGVFLGAWASSKMSGDRNAAAVPGLWRERFGSAKGKRFAAAFAGGAIMMLGARLAGGCTSGHGISGTLQLAVSSWIFLLTMFVTAIVVASLMYGRRGGAHV
jgi:hypothetical protein